MESLPIINPYTMSSAFTNLSFLFTLNWLDFVIQDFFKISWKLHLFWVHVFFFFNWSIVAFQCCVTKGIFLNWSIAAFQCCITKWISCVCVCVPPPSWTSNPTSPPSHPSRSSENVSWAPCTSQQAPPCICFTHVSAHASIPISQFITPIPCPMPTPLFYTSGSLLMSWK